MKRVVAIEKADVNPEEEAKDIGHVRNAHSSVISNCHIIQGNAREKSLQLTIGGNECSPTALKLFMDHYNMDKSQKMKRNVAGWGNAEFRANELRYQLRGEQALCLSQEDYMCMLSLWVKEDVEVIRGLNGRLMGTQFTELNIIAFEELSQNQADNLSQYMTRCRGLGQQAFSEFGEL